MRIVIIEDDEAIGFSLRIALEDEGHEVTVFNNPLTVPFDSLVADIVLLDYYMPGMDGMAVAQRLRSDSRLNTTRIIMMSASPQLLPMAKKLNLEYISKPFDLPVLYARINKQ